MLAAAAGPIPGVLPKEHFGTNAMAQIATLRCLGTSEGKIRETYCTLRGGQTVQALVRQTAEGDSGRDHAKL